MTATTRVGAAGAAAGAGSCRQARAPSARPGRRRLAALVALVTAAAAAPALSQGVALAGGDAASVRLPAAAKVEPYANAGYRLRVEEGRALVDVTLAPLASRDPFVLPQAGKGRQGGDPIVALARAVTAGATTRYDAVSRLLAWVGRNVEYRLDRGAPQDAAATLARRDGYCTGVARLTVALLAAVGIPAREVPGFVAAPSGEVPAGFHRWVEVQYQDVGWVFSDPLVAHHYVPATYVRLASETLLADGDREPRLLARNDRRQPTDLFAEAPPRVTIRRNLARQRAAALRITVGSGGAAVGRALLTGEGSRWAQPFQAGASTFVGLQPGEYLLRVEVDGWSPVEKRVILRDRVAASIHLPRPETARLAPPARTASAELEATK